MSTAVTGDVSGEPSEINTSSVVHARDEIAREIASGAVVVSARRAKTLLAGFDALVQHVAQAHQGYEADCNKIVSLRLGAVMAALGDESVTLTEAGFNQLRERRSVLSFTPTPDGKGIVYTLTHPTTQGEEH